MIFKQSENQKVAEAFPSPPADPKWWCWINNADGSETTKLVWGSHYVGAIVAEAPPNGPYTYVIKTTEATCT